MAPSSTTIRTALLACAVFVSYVAPSHAADPVRIVFQNGSSIAVSSVTQQGDNLVVTGAPEGGYTQGQAIPLQSADHVFGEQPAGINQGVAQLLWDSPKDAIKLLEPVVASQRSTAKIPGNYWLEAARAALVAYAVTGNSEKCNEIGKEISAATPAQGTDPFVLLGKALLLPSSTKVDDRVTALRELTIGNQPADVSAYASYYIGDLLLDAKRKKEALEAYLSVPCLFPSGGIILNAAAEIKAAELLKELTRPEEALALINSALRASGGTVLAAEAKKRLESLK